MYCIETNIENTIVIKKSKFITKLYKINDIGDINSILLNVKKIYNNATHICYAYTLNNLEKCFDDGEPCGTAGMPILNVLKKNHLHNVLAIVIRYFGGIKLGAGGLVRAYSSSIINAIKLTKIVDLADGYIINITFNYNNIKNIDNLLKNININDKIYDDVISYRLYISQTNYLLIEKRLKDLCISVDLIKNILM